ncbi:putative caspase-like protein [Actinomadura viridis]|uniref:Caspase-like protein n=1 Tax=Actinomadura viridis TaxID=58110 RepID=A0A931DBM0_9ACTN|nr:putative caspase-like protein [Actinomadura viridis]
MRVFVTGASELIGRAVIAKPHRSDLDSIRPDAASAPAGSLEHGVGHRPESRALRSSDAGQHRFTVSAAQSHI